MDVETVGDSAQMAVVAKKNYSYPHETWSKHLLPGGCRGTALCGSIVVETGMAGSTAEQAVVLPLTHVTLREGKVQASFMNKLAKTVL